MRGVTGARTAAHTSSDPRLTMDTRQEPTLTQTEDARFVAKPADPMSRVSSSVTSTRSTSTSGSASGVSLLTYCLPIVTSIPPHRPLFPNTTKIQLHSTSATLDMALLLLKLAVTLFLGELRLVYWVEHCYHDSFQESDSQNIMKSSKCTLKLIEICIAFGLQIKLDKRLFPKQKPASWELITWGTL